MADDYTNTVLTAGLVGVGGATSGAIETAGDADWFKVTLTAGQTYAFFLIGNQFGGTQPNTLEDPLLRVLDAQGALLTLNDNGWGRNSILSFTAPTTGIYFLAASSGSGRPTGTGTYQLSVKPFASVAEQADFLVNGWFAYVAESGNGDSPTPRQWASGPVSVNVSALTVAEQNVALTVLQLYHDVANISFTVTTGPADITYTDVGSGQAQIANWSVNGAFFTSVTVNISSDFSPTAGVNTPMFQAYLHETGHALGLGHSGPYAGGSPAFGFANLFGNDTLQSTVMTYFGWPGRALADHVITPQMADIYAVQSMYGANTATRLGNTTYGFNSTAGSYFDFASYGPLIAFTIYDSGGTDTLDASGYAVSQRIDLTPGRWSSIGGETDNIGIYLTTLIENAFGGSSTDQILGNAASNALSGNAGNDMLMGKGGDDVLIGGAGADSLIGGSGMDTASYAGALVGVTASLLTPGGNTGDALGDAYSSIENLRGSSRIDVLEGNNNPNTLNGGSGADTMIGAAGNDTYVVDVAGDVTLEISATGGTDLVLSSVTRTLGANLEKLTLTGVGVINGTGNTLNNVITGNSVANTLSGLGGADTLSGGGGGDRLIGGAGLDILTGGSGADRFVFNSAPAVADRDTINDYNVAADTIQILGAAFVGIGALGVLAAGKFHIGAAAADSGDRIIYNAATGALYYDADGNSAGAQIQFATLSTGLLLTAVDFVVI